MDPRVARICRCPACRAELAFEEGACACTGCSASYAVEGGVPILVREGDRIAPVARWETGASALVPKALRPFVERYHGALRPPLTFKSARGRSLLDDFVAEHGDDQIVLNVGSGETEYGRHVLNLDIDAFPGVHVVGVAENLPVADESCDAVLSIAVLEHVADAGRALAEARRALRVGGRIFVDVPFMQGYHASPADHRRFTEQGLRAELEREGFDVEQSGVAVGPASGMAWIASEFLALLLSAGSPRRYQAARFFTTWLALPVKYADRWLERHPMAHTISSAVWATASKRDAVSPAVPPTA
jgi:SAM-dependent methyltransferase/uncharacterized protein YbaR (Trm112 family)